MTPTRKPGTNGSQKEATTSSIDPELFNEVLFHVQDLLNRSLINFMVLKDLARAMQAERFGWDQKPKLSAIELGVKKTALTESGLSMFKTLLELYNMEADIQPGLIRMKYKGVPIFIKVIQRKYKFFENPDTVFYRIESFSIPNPFQEYWPARFLIK